MSCHYSCAGCSELVSFDSCLGCPSTRYLQSGVCYCFSGFSEVLAADCLQLSESWYDITLKVLYYFSIVMYLVVLLSQMVRYRLVLTKKLIDIHQTIALCLYFRWNYSTVARQALSVLDTYNFAYANAYCNKAAPPLNCTGFENMIAPAIVLAIFCVLYFVAYSIVYFRHPEVLTFKSFHRQNFPNVLLVYLNATIILNTLAFARLVYYSMWALLILGPFVILVMMAFRHFYRLVNNDNEQTKLVYRTQHCQLFLYDHNYHVNYIDHLYEQVEFRLRSNFQLLELLFKMLWAGGIIINYKYKPSLVGYVLVLLLWIAMLRMRLFFKYQNLKLLGYFLLDLVMLGALTVFWIGLFDYILFYAVCSLQGLLIASYIWQMVVNRFQSKVQNRVFNEVSDGTNPSEHNQPQPAKNESSQAADPPRKRVMENTSNALLLVDP